LLDARCGLLGRLFDGGCWRCCFFLLLSRHAEDSQS
jgi:hypothetical protein